MTLPRDGHVRKEETAIEQTQRTHILVYPQNDENRNDNSFGCWGSTYHNPVRATSHRPHRQLRWTGRHFAP